ncbi:hypothetical protein F5Y18DRAFT_187548 [Xylariaceae sp. FL1019]|nr:hypothetical protein F5Y18DRAFT_187548 [Xylariaceae sp. FL1019]
MVYIPPPAGAPRLNAYLVTDFSDEELQKFKHAFEFGTCAPFSPMLELVIQRAPAHYLGKSFKYLRTEETGAGRKDPFVLIDEGAKGGRDGAVWYVDRFADQQEVDDGEAESTNVVWRIYVKTDCLPLTYVNYDIANMSIGEDLDNAGVEMPVTEHFVQEEVSDCGGLDMEDERNSHDAWIVAGPGEFEESTDEELRNNFMPRPDKVARLKEHVAKANGLVNRWTLCGGVRPRKMPDGSLQEFPKGSVTLQLRYDPHFEWPAYKWPEGSL